MIIFFSNKFKGKLLVHILFQNREFSLKMLKAAQENVPKISFQVKSYLIGTILYKKIFKLIILLSNT